MRCLGIFLEKDQKKKFINVKTNVANIEQIVYNLIIDKANNPVKLNNYIYLLTGV